MENKNIKLAAIQMSCKKNVDENIEKADILVKKAIKEGAKIILLPELFERQYFCQERQYEYYNFANTIEDNKAINHFKKLAKELDVVLPISFYEKSINNLYNSVAIIDADGSILGIYRKTHIPDDHFYQEKFYFTPGNTGFKVWDTKYAKIGVGICWDQWFPEAARCMALMGADILFYPTAIGSEPILDCDSMKHWQRTIKGHAAANIIPVVVANRVGIEEVSPCKENSNQKSNLNFYGSSFITDELGEIKSLADRDKEDVIFYDIDIEKNRQTRLSWGLFRDRRPSMYGGICK